MKRILTILLALFLLAPPPALSTEILSSGYISGSSLTKGQAKQALEDIVSLIKELVGGTAQGDLTLATDAVAVPDDAAVFTINAESGVTDDCANLTGNVRDGRVVAIAPASGDTITFKHLATGAGQLSMKDGNDLEVSDDRVYTFFIFNEGDNIWYEFGPRDLTAQLNKLPGSTASTTKTISSGSITPDSWETAVDNESAAAADDLDTIATTNSLPLVILRQGTAGKVPTIKHGTGNIVTQDGKDLDLDDLDKRIAFMRSGSDYVEIFRSGFYSWSTSSKTSTFTALWGNSYLCDTSSAGFTANVQTAVGHQGEEIEFIKVSSDSNSLTIDPNSTETANGSSTATMSSQWEAKRYRSNGTNLVEVANGFVTLPPTKGGTGITSWTTGDVPYASATNVLSKLAAGTNGYVMTMVAGVPGWAAVAGPTRFVSSDQTPTFGSTKSVAHSLGSTPKHIWGYLRCTSAELGFSVGDIIFVGSPNIDSGAAYGISIGASSTNVFAKIAGTGIGVVDSSAAYAISVIDTTKWKLVLCAEL